VIHKTLDLLYPNSFVLYTEEGNSFGGIKFIREVYGEVSCGNIVFVKMINNGFVTGNDFLKNWSVIFCILVYIDVESSIPDIYSKEEKN